MPAEVSIPLIVLPLIAFVLSLVTLVVLLVLSTGVLLAGTLSPAPPCAGLRFIQEPLIPLYGLTMPCGSRRYPDGCC